jgi:hypothetical protein
VHILSSPYICRPPTQTFFPSCLPAEDNELLTLEVVHQFVEVLDKYFGNVCELDLIFNFHKARRGGSPGTPAHSGSMARLGGCQHMAAGWPVVTLQRQAVCCLVCSLLLSCAVHHPGDAAPLPQAYFILDELLLAGELQEPSKKAVGRCIEAQDQLVEQVKAGNVTETEFASFSGPRG